MGPGNHVLDEGPDPTMGRGNFEGTDNFEGGNGRSIGKYRGTLRSSVQKWLNRSRCHLDCGLEWAPGICARYSPDPHEGAIFGERGAHCKV